MMTSLFFGSANKSVSVNQTIKAILEKSYTMDSILVPMYVNLPYSLSSNIVLHKYVSFSSNLSLHGTGKFPYGMNLLLYNSYVKTFGMSNDTLIRLKLGFSMEYETLLLNIPETYGMHITISSIPRPYIQQRQINVTVCNGQPNAT
jgi:hypothetical protein